MIDRRNFDRIRQKSIVKIGDEEGFLLDFSEEGLGISVRRIPEEREITVRLKFEDKEFILNGEIIWEGWHKGSTELSDIGIQLADPPEDYIRFVKTVLSNP